MVEIWKNPLKFYWHFAFMPTFLDAHPMGTVEEETLKQAQKMPKGADGLC